MQAITTPDGRTLTVREGGDPAGVPVLFLAGTPGSSLLYEPHVVDAKKRGIRLISYDRPGYGGSTRKKHRKVSDCAADVAAVCDALGIGRFCVWGISGGGPHALATAALLPDRVVAAAALASPAPFDGEGLDYFEGMGRLNVQEFGAVLAGEEAHLEVMERDYAEMMSITPDQLVDAWQTLLGPADREVAVGPVAAAALEQIRAGIGHGYEGWFDDDLVFLKPWGFEVDRIRVPVLHWHGEQDQFVPFGHGVWLSKHIPGVVSRLTPEDGHLTLFEHRIPEVHQWLVGRYAQAHAADT